MMQWGFYTAVRDDKPHIAIVADDEMAYLLRNSFMNNNISKLREVLKESRNEIYIMRCVYLLDPQKDLVRDAIMLKLLASVDSYNTLAYYAMSKGYKGYLTNNNDKKDVLHVVAKGLSN